MKRVLYFCLGLIGFLSLLCSIAASSVTNEALMKQGFLGHSQTAHLNVPAGRYADYAKGICRYLDGKAAEALVTNPNSGVLEAAFSDKENAHLADVRGLVTALKIIRWAGGGLVIGALLLLYVKNQNDKARFLADAVRGFSLSALFLLSLAGILAVWGAINFDGLFVTFHKIVFSNDLWLLNPQTDLLLALMPVPFFVWYAGELLKSMLPVLGMMLAVIIASKRIEKTQKEQKTT